MLKLDMVPVLSTAVLVPETHEPFFTMSVRCLFLA